MENLVSQQPKATLDELLTEGIRIASEITRSQLGSIRLLDEETEELYYRAVYTQRSQEKYWTEEILLKSYSLDADSLGVDVVNSGQPLLSNYVKSILRYKPVSEYVIHALHVPIPVAGKTIGVLTVNRIEDKEVEEYDIAGTCRTYHASSYATHRETFQPVRAGAYRPRCSNTKIHPPEAC